VEALGDAYMVASGLPVRNGHKHAGEIARFAIAIHKEITNFHVPDLDQRSIIMRVAIHSGMYACVKFHIFTCPFPLIFFSPF